MKLSEQVCTLEQGKRLQEFGVTAPSLFTWHKAKSPAHAESVIYGKTSDSIAPAYTVAELGEMLPMYCASCNTHTGWGCIYKTRTEGLIHTEDCHFTEAQARAAMLIYLLENNLITLK